MVLVGSSGEGGAKLHRRNFGEAVENLTGSGEYHWMAGNFLKYGAAESSFGSKNAGDLPVDSNELIALCAPRPTFISYGVPEKGDAKWLDQQGSFMATVAAGPVFRLLGAKDLGVNDDYRSAKMPPVNTGLLEGQLAWRQHDGGTHRCSELEVLYPLGQQVLSLCSPDLASPGRSAGLSGGCEFHGRSFPAARKGEGIGYRRLLRRRFDHATLDATDYPELMANWKQNFFGWNAADFGWGGDRTQNILWRLQNGELDGVNPKVVVLLAGTNNVSDRAAPGSDEEKAGDITRGVQAILRVLQEKAPAATIIVMGIFPRNDNPAFMPIIDKINHKLSQVADGKKIRSLNINEKLADHNGMLFEGMMNPDKLHLTVKAYQVWADALKPELTELLGPPAASDHAPAPTGDPESHH